MSADIQTADMLHLPVPELVGGKPTNVVLQPSEVRKEWSKAWQTAPKRSKRKSAAHGR